MIIFPEESIPVESLFTTPIVKLKAIPFKDSMLFSM